MTNLRIWCADEVFVREQKIAKSDSGHEKKETEGTVGGV